jgi:peptidoglycan/xylan/chitin deacetylase (PgdA/CDA1 family)
MRFLAAMMALMWAFAGLQPPEPPSEEPRVAILIYHHLNGDQEPDEPNTISTSEFERHLRMLKEQGYHLLTLRQFEAYMEGILTPPDRSVLLTFDDGYMSVYQRAFPLLRQYGAPAVIFPVMKYYHTQGHGAWSPHLVYWQTQVMQASGLVDLGGHTYDGHGYVPTGEEGRELGPFTASRMWLQQFGRLELEEEYRLRIRRDLERMLDVMEELGLRGFERNHFALPFGKATPELLAELQTKGILYVYTTDDSGVNTRSTDRFHLYRIDAGNHIMTAEKLQRRLAAYFAKPTAPEVPVESPFGADDPRPQD